MYVIIRAFLLAALTCAGAHVFAQTKRPVTSSDCVTVRELKYDESTVRGVIKMSPDGSLIAYPVRLPDIPNNKNEIAVYVKSVPIRSTDSSEPLIRGDIVGLRWRPDGKALTALMTENGRRVLEEIDPTSGTHRVLVSARDDIAEYTTSNDGSVVVYGTLVPNVATAANQSNEASASGYLVPFEENPGGLQFREQLFLTRRQGATWTSPEVLSIQSPLSGDLQKGLVYGGAPNLMPTLSPDGNSLLVTYYDYSQKMPDDWRQSGFMQVRNRAGVIQAFRLLALYDVRTGRTTTPFKTPFNLAAPIWSSDSESFLAVGHPPIGSELERENLRTGMILHSTGTHLFWVEPGSGKVEDVAPKVAYPWGGPLFWAADGDIYVQSKSLTEISRYSRSNGRWAEVSSWQLPKDRIGTQATTNGKYVIGDYSDTMTPPELFIYAPGNQELRVFAKLNPQFDNLSLGSLQEVHWKTLTGFDATGLAILPPDHVPGKRYPLVIQTKPFGSFFVCSFGNYPSFAPQPTANAGVIYLGQIATKGSTQREEDYYPKNYPGAKGIGGIAEAAFAMDLWDSAVKSLDEQGLIDKDRVGIIGFSRTGWYTEFILTHSKVPYRAATIADNIQFSYGEYSLFHSESAMKQFDQTYGGPPYGETLKNWLDYSISFNLDKVHAPLLLEEMGNGVPSDNPLAPSIYLTKVYEIVTGLTRLKKPFELYFYPNEDHTPSHPKARLATLQRNVDWYRFWLKGEEDPDPTKAEQYKRWRELRKLQEQDQKKAVAPPK